MQTLMNVTNRFKFFLDGGHETFAILVSVCLVFNPGWEYF
jgi:hypothetical protein